MKHRTYRKSILDLTQKLVDGMIDKHSQVLPVRLDLRFPQDYQNDGRNTEIQRALKQVSMHYRRQNTDIAYLVAREQDTSHNPHYHAWFLVDGNKHQCPHDIQKTVTEKWVGCVGGDPDGMVDYCKHKETHPLPPMEKIVRPSSKATGEELERQTEELNRTRKLALDHASYLAKEDTKCRSKDTDTSDRSSKPKPTIPDGVREVLASQVIKRAKPSKS